MGFFSLIISFNKNQYGDQHEELINEQTIRTIVFFLKYYLVIFDYLLYHSLLQYVSSSVFINLQIKKKIITDIYINIVAI